VGEISGGGFRPVSSNESTLESRPETNSGTGSHTSDISGANLVGILAKEHIGALMVIRGNGPLERHITGGNTLSMENHSRERC